MTSEVVRLRRLIGIGAVCLLVVGLSACAKASSPGDDGESGAGSPQAVSHGGPVTDQVSLIDALRAGGAMVAIDGDANQPFLTPTGTRLSITGTGLAAATTVEVYEYDDAAAVSKDADQIEPAGNPKTSRITWVDDPHFYRAERVLVLYVGSDATMTTLLAGLLGPQFAGK